MIMKIKLMLLLMMMQTTTQEILLSLLDPDIIINKIRSEKPHTMFDNKTEKYINVIPATNASKFEYSIDQETDYDGNFNNIEIYGSILLNQCGIFFTRGNY